MTKAELEKLVADQQTHIQQLQNENSELKGRTASDSVQLNTLYNKFNNLSIGKE